jgi:OmpA-OmpF porin, OOP family
MIRHALLAVPAVAALACVPGAASAQPVSGLYIGLGAGGNILQTNPITNRVGDQIHFDVGEAGVASVGWGFGNGFRVELEGNFRHNGIRELTIPQFPTASSGDRYTYGGMVNGLFDLDIRSPYVYPYLGVGLGYTWNQFDKFRAVSPGGYAYTINDTQGSFSYQGIIGASFPIPPVVGLSLTLEYRFLGTVGDRNYKSTDYLPGSGGGAGLAVPSSARIADAYNHSVLLGLRYAFNVAPPPPPPVAPAPAPVAQPTRTYLVFFDWDKSNLTERARQIIAEAAQASQRVQVTRIEVNGYTDLSGTAKYNQGLSVRRANAVAAELVRDGVPQGEIVARGFGESNPLVPTAQGVREPQNRRVEIILR